MTRESGPATRPAGAAHVVVPAGIDDPERPSGGNVYDRRLVRELADLGWVVHEHPVAGAWPQPAPADRAALGRVLAGLPRGAVVVVDGLIASAAPAQVVPEAERLRLVVLLHMPLAEALPGAAVARAERAVLAAAGAVVTTSGWARDWVVAHHGLAPARVHVAPPGADLRAVAPGTATGGALLCVAAVTPGKGHDTLIAALAGVADLPWRCTCVGALDLDPGFVDRLRDDVREAGLTDRVTFTGPLTGTPLEAVRHGSDLVVSASVRESYGMAVTEGLASGIPVLATAVGGQPEAVGTVEGALPGLLVPAGDPDRLAEALRAWLTDDALRERWRAVAARRRAALGTWTGTARRVAAALTEGLAVNRQGRAAVPSTSSRRTG